MSNAAEQLSFWQLIQKNQIEIPIIQRDYAQGRQDNQAIRKKFLEALRNAFETAPIELDFIYGSKKGDCLQPLDGQQRLTTLFLLHWYAAAKESALNKSEKQILKRFFYETRISSREFCNELVDKGVLIPSDDSEISKLIKNESWFYLSWEKDPTINAMLIMLDAIHRTFRAKSNLWETLIRESACPITFHYIQLEHFGLSDDLYIKMNARGKQLTPFESLKTRFIAKIEQEKWDDGKSVTNEFKHKTDTSWTDLFWKYRNLEDKNKIIEHFYVRFIAGIAMNEWALRTNRTATDAEKRIQELLNHPETVTPNDFDKASYDILYQLLDLYCDDVKRQISCDAPFWRYVNDKNRVLFEVLIQSTQATYTQRVLFYAQTVYFLKQAVIRENAFQDWMRVICNITYHATIDKPETFISALRLVRELSDGCENIYEWLSKNNVKSGFAANQVKEEILKAQLIIVNPSYKTEIFATEDTSFCQGRIGFALYCTGYESNKDTFEVEKLFKIRNIIEVHLSKADITNDFRRGLLTIKDNLFYNYWWSWAYVLEANKRCLIENTSELKAFAYKEVFRDYLKDLLNQLINKELRDLIDAFNPDSNMPNWKKLLIKEPDLLDKDCGKHFIAIPQDEKCCYLLKGQRPNANQNSYKKIE